MVVSSVTPLMPAAVSVQRPGARRSCAGACRARRATPGVVLARLGDRAGLLELGTLVHEQGRVAAVVEDHVGATAVGPPHGLLGAPPVLLERLALPGEDGDAARGVDGAVRADDHRGRGVVLRREDVAGHPADVSAQRGERLDEHRRLDGHVQRAHDAGAGQRLGVGVLGPDGHEAGHLVLGEADLAAAPVGQGQVGDLEVALSQRGHGVTPSMTCRVGCGAGCGAPLPASSGWAQQRHPCQPEVRRA